VESLLPLLRFAGSLGLHVGNLLNENLLSLVQCRGASLQSTLDFRLHLGPQIFQHRPARRAVTEGVLKLGHSRMDIFRQRSLILRHSHELRPDLLCNAV